MSEPIDFYTAFIQLDRAVSLKLSSLVDAKHVAYLSVIGLNLPSNTPSQVSKDDNTLTVHWADSVTLTLTHHEVSGGHRYDVLWEVKNKAVTALTDTISLDNAHWYGGAQVKKQEWPIEKWNRPLAPYVAGDSFADEYGGVQERYWLSSRGVALFVEPEVPLFVSINKGEDKLLQLVSKWASPYKNVSGESLQLKYSILQALDVRQVHLLALDQGILAKPTDIPDEKVFRYPIWSTWAKYKKDINQDTVLAFSDQISEHGFPVSQIEIDDDWTSSYGDMDFNHKTFPDPKEMIQAIQEKGHRVTVWVHPFASPFAAASDLKEYWIHSGVMPGYTIWWNGIGKLLDLTNPNAVCWFKSRLENLRSEYKIDSFKFDAGEINWLPMMARTHEAMSNPNIYTTKYAELAAEMDTTLRCQEVRVGVRTQHLPIFVRMMDKSSNWSSENGLKTLIPHALTFSMIGYPFILPDMIGGNAYPKTAYPEPELFVRWLQANVFLPVLQFSIPPWQYDENVLEISRDMVALHEQYADVILELAHGAVTSGQPIIRPLWWVSPNDELAQVSDSQFLVGDDLLVAPVLEKGAVSRDIYIPEGNWKDMISGKILSGPRTYENYPAELKHVPFFTRTDEPVRASSPALKLDVAITEATRDELQKAGIPEPMSPDIAPDEESDIEPIDAKDEETGEETPGGTSSSFTETPQEGISLNKDITESESQIEAEDGDKEAVEETVESPLEAEKGADISDGQVADQEEIKTQE